MFAATFFNVRPLPVRVMHGDLDAIVPYAPNARVALTAGTPNVRLASIAKGTHGPALGLGLARAGHIE